MEFREFGKIPRLNRGCTITEKINGTNGAIHIGTHIDGSDAMAYVDGLEIYAGSRTRWIVPGDDNHGFALWVYKNVEELIKLGPGTHYGEWWGKNINRGYGLDEKRFSLFNTARWSDPAVRPTCCHVVPVLYEGPFNTGYTTAWLEYLQILGSRAAPDYMDPEGIVVFHHAGNNLFKATIKGDEAGKHEEAHVKKIKEPRPPKDPSKGGRRKEQVEIPFFDRRKVA